MNSQIRKILLVSLIGICFFSGFGLAQGAEKFSNDDDLEKIRKEIIDLVNQERSKEGLERLKESQKLNQAAFLKAQDMIGNNYFAHVSPSNISPWYWFGEVDYQYKYAGENLAMNFSSASSVHRAWMKSESHRENILSSRYSEIGVAVLKGIIDGEETLVAVQEFGFPLGEGDGDIEEKIREKFKNSVSISEASVQKWESQEGNEYLVYAYVVGNPQKVEALINGKPFSLEKLRENVYMNLIYVEDEVEEGVMIKAQADDKNAQFFEAYLKDKEGESSFAQANKKHDQNKNNFSLESSIFSKDEKDGQKNEKIISGSFLISAMTKMNEQIILLLLLAVFLFLVVSVWILEKEEEKLLIAIEKSLTLAKIDHKLLSSHYS